MSIYTDFKILEIASQQVKRKKETAFRIVHESQRKMSSPEDLCFWAAPDVDGNPRHCTDQKNICMVLNSACALQADRFLRAHNQKAPELTVCLPFHEKV